MSLQYYARNLNKFCCSKKYRLNGKNTTRTFKKKAAETRMLPAAIVGADIWRKKRSRILISVYISANRISKFGIIIRKYK